MRNKELGLTAGILQVSMSQDNWKLEAWVGGHWQASWSLAKQPSTFNRLSLAISGCKSGSLRIRNYRLVSFIVLEVFAWW